MSSPLESPYPNYTRLTQNIGYVTVENRFDNNDKTEYNIPLAILAFNDTSNTTPYMEDRCRIIFYFYNKEIKITVDRNDFQKFKEYYKLYHEQVVSWQMNGK
jgi:hypothetical protein